MTEKIENKNLEVRTWSAEGKVNTYADKLKGKEIGKQETEKEHQQAEDMLKNINQPKSKEAKKETVKNPSSLTPDIDTAISNLHRPEAEKGIRQSYTNIDTTIKNSKNEKWIAGFLGKIMNKILR